MINIGLTGGLASGKSAVGRQLEKLGCFVIRMDDLGHQVLEPGGEAYGPVVTEFGPDIVNADGSINRRLLGGRVFADPTQLKKLGSLVHPPVRARAKVLRDAFAASSPDAIIVTEAAIMIETGSHKEYDRLILVVCRPEQQIERAMERDGLTQDEVESRIRRQMPLEDKRKYANYVIDTSGTKENTEQQTRSVYEVLRKLTH
ncbi:MAG: dephospho-CoA kinase [Acidobacteriota bacterium]